MVGIFSSVNPAGKVPIKFERQVLIANIIALVIGCITIGICAVLYNLFGWIITLPYLLPVSFLFFTIPAINNRIDHKTGRILLCLMPIWLTMFFTIYTKLADEKTFTYLMYFDSRFLLMAASVLPGIVFRLEERFGLLISLASAALLLFFFDPIHELFGVGYFQKGFTERSYYYVNYIVSVSYTILLFGILMLRSVMERAERNLTTQYAELVEKQNEIEAQHEELLQHQEEMVASTEKLEEANRLIMHQREELQKYNASLSALVEEKSFQLLHANEELIKYNNELLQFSYTVSHNLRGPVARLLGLTRLMKLVDGAEEKKRMEDFVLRSSEELDEILKDLSLIIDMRNDLFRVREKILLQEEWNRAVSLLGESVKSIYKLTVDFSAAPYIYGVRPMVQSIFYNLLGNAIKYQSPERKLKINVISFIYGNNDTVIEIQDNGLGIDLHQQKNNLFKLYKRFHSHVSGKGLGLYLVKTQLETMGGTITVESEVDQGTTFRLLFKHPDQIARQVIYDTDAVQFYYDGNLNVTVIEWKRETTSAEYREVAYSFLNTLKTYQIPAWIADIRKQGNVDQDDQAWFSSTIFPELVKCGLKNVAILGPDTLDEHTYFTSVKLSAASFGCEIKTFHSLHESLIWLESCSVSTQHEVKL